MPTLPKETVNTSGHIIFTPFAISRAIQKIKSNGSAGPDGLPALFWKKAAASVAFPLSIIFNNSFMSSSVPDEWRLATVIPVFKKGCPSSPNNYRPISLTCIPCKIMESIIKDHKLTFLNANNLISANQHDFTPNKSTFTQLLECVHDWASAVESRSPVHVIYIDFKKAFDSVSLTKLLY